MKVYDVYFKGSRLTLMRKGLTEEQMDKFWNSIKWWEKQSLDIKEREVTPEKEQYESYLKEYCETMNPSVMLFDLYHHSFPSVLTLYRQ